MNSKIKPSIIAIFVAAVVTLIAGCSGGGQYIDGTYEGTAKGAKSDIKVSVNVKKEKIEKIEIVEHDETQNMIDAAIDNTIPEIIEKQSTAEVDAVSGASKSSEAVIQAVDSALLNAKKN